LSLSRKGCLRSGLRKKGKGAINDGKVGEEEEYHERFYIIVGGGEGKILSQKKHLSSFEWKRRQTMGQRPLQRCQLLGVFDTGTAGGGVFICHR